MFVPKRFLTAGLNIMAAYEIDQSGYAIQDLRDRTPGLAVEIYWRAEIGGECPKCNGLSDTVWHDFDELLNDRTFTENEAGIYGLSHPGCRCHLEIHLEHGEGIYAVEVSSPYAIHVGGLTAEELLEEHEKAAKQKVETDDEQSFFDKILKDFEDPDSATQPAPEEDEEPPYGYDYKDDKPEPEPDPWDEPEPDPWDQ
jgi:hypothetical protein